VPSAAATWRAAVWGAESEKGACFPLGCNCPGHDQEQYRCHELATRVGFTKWLSPLGDLGLIKVPLLLCAGQRAVEYLTQDLGNDSERMPLDLDIDEAGIRHEAR
jgi:hypothetical protein